MIANSQVDRRGLRRTAGSAHAAFVSLVVLVSTLAVIAGLTGPAGAAAPTLPRGTAAVAAVNPAPAFSTVAAAGPTTVTGSIATDTVWSPEGSPYLLSGTVIVQPTASLTLLPGTVVKFNDQSPKLVGYGQVLSLGTPEDRVTFTSIKDDSVGGDSNGDGNATAPARGDWYSISLGNPNNATRETFPVSVLNYTDVRWGGASGANACQAAMVEITDSRNRVVIANSSFTDAQVAGVGTSRVGTNGYQGIYNNHFARSMCGLKVAQAGGEVVGNYFADSFTASAVQALYPERLRFWFNTVHGKLGIAGDPPSVADADVSYNQILGGLGGTGTASQQLQTYGPNWWGRDINTEVFPTCVSSDERNAYQPPISAPGDTTCPDLSRLYRVAGWRYGITPALSAPPPDLPASLTRPYAPSYGPVDTRRGSLSYEAEDISIEDAGVSVGFRRTYDSARAAGGDVGNGWRSSYSDELSVTGAGSSLTTSEGDSMSFTADPAAGYVNARGVAASYEAGVGGTTITTPNQTGYEFDSAGQLSSVLLGDKGHKLDIDRDSDGKVDKLTGVSDRFLDYHRGGGTLNQVTDDNGRSVTLTHDGSDRLESVTGVDGKTETYEYSGNKLTKVTSPNGVVRLEAGYDSDGRVEWVKEAGSGRADFEYRSDGATVTTADGTKIDHIVDEYGRMVSETVRGRSGRHVIYDGEGRIVAQIDGVPTEAMTGYSAIAQATFYDRKGDPVVEVDPLGRGTATVFNAKHRPVKVTTAGGAVTSYTYDTDGRPDTVTDPRGEVWNLTHNGKGQLRTVTDPLGRVKTYTYAADGDLESVIDELGSTTTYETNARGLPTAVVDPLTHRTEYTYTAWGQPLTVTKPRGGVDTATFDDDRNLVSVQDATGATTTYEYDTSGRLDAVIDPEGGRSTIAYDNMGRPVEFEDARGTIHERTYTPEGWSKTVTGPGTDATNEAVTTTAYDPAGRPVRVTNALGHITQTVYNRAGEVVRIDRPDGGSESFSYDLDGRERTTATPTGGTWTNTWDPAGNLLTRKNPMGGTETRAYDKVSRLTTLTDVRGTLTTTTYDDIARTITSSDSLGLVQKLTLDATGRVFKVEDGRGLVERLTFNADGQPIQVRNGEAEDTDYTYDLAGRQLTQSDPRGNTVEVTYDQLSRVVERTYPDDTTEDFTYDPAGNLTERIDRTGQSWTATFDAANRVVKEKDPLEAETTYAYDLLGQQTSLTDPTGVTTEYGYDAVGNLTTITDPVVDASQTMTYDTSGNLLTQALPGGFTVTNTYDLNDRLTKSAPTGGLASVNLTYDAAGNTLTRKQSTQTFTFEYDTRGRASAFIDALANRTTYDVDASGNRVAEHLPSGRTKSWTYDNANRITSANAGAGASSTYGYDLAGNLDTVGLPSGADYTYTYDSENRLTSQTNPIGKTTSFRYDAEGRLTKTIRPNLDEIISTYDAAGRETSRTAPSTTGATGTVERAYGYDAAGRPTTVGITGTPSSNVSVNYDDRGLPESSTDRAGTTDYTHDAAGRLTGLDQPNSTAAVFTYNLANQVATIRGPTNFNFAYDAWGNRTATTAVAPTSTTTQNRTYDKNNRLTGVSYGTGNNLSATYNADGQTATTTAAIAGVTNAREGTTTYSYGTAGRLISASHTIGTTTSVTGWEWDVDGNRTNVTPPTGPAVTYDHDDAGQLTTASDGTTYTHDANGQLTETNRPGAAEDTTLAYDGFGDVISQTHGTATTTYARDGLGRVGASTTGSTTKTFGYSGLSTHLTGIDNGATPQAIIRDTHGLPVSMTQGTTTHHAWLNIHGDLTAWRAQSGGAFTSTSLYDAFGDPTRTGTDPVGLGYQAMSQDPASGLVNMNARFYNPTTGTFTAEDTIIGDLRAPITLNRYTYANAAPLDYFDPDGRFGIGDLIDAAKEFGEKVVGGAKSLYDKGKNAVKSLGNALSSAGSGVASAVSSASRAAVSAVNGAAAKARSSVKAFQQLVSDANIGGSIRHSIDSASGQLRTLASSIDTDAAHTALNFAGFIPGPIGVIADVTNAGIYFIEGDTKNALISLAATILPTAAAAAIGGTAAKYLGRGASRARRPAARAQSAPGFGSGSGPWVDGIPTRPGGAIAQSTNGSCVSACGAMLSGGSRTQDDLLDKLGNWSNPRDLANELGDDWIGGFFGSADQAIQAARRGPMGATLQAGTGPGHMVVTSPLEGGRFLVRDPWNGGSTYQVGEDWIAKYVSGGVFK